MLLVAAIPVAMPTVLSVTMAVGARLLAKKEAIVTRLAGDRGTGRRRRAVLGQDRHADPEQADAGRSIQRERYPRPTRSFSTPHLLRVRKTRTPSTSP